MDNERPSYGIFGEKNAKYLKQIKKDVLKTKIIKYFLKRGTFSDENSPKNIDMLKLYLLGCVRNCLRASYMYTCSICPPSIKK